jgi:histidinol-phosphate aminotransferase
VIISRKVVDSLKVTPRKSIESIKPYVPGKPIREVAREFDLTDIVKLASNENALGPSPLACQAITAFLTQIHRYPDSEDVRELKQGIAEHLSVQPEEIILGNGSNEILELITRTFVNPGEEILTAESTFLVYAGLIQIAAAKGRFVPLKEFTFDLDQIVKAVGPQTKLILIANPNNPTGTFVTQTQVDKFLEQIPDHVLVVFDEAYFDFTDPKTFPDLLSKPRENVMVIRTFSKSYGLAGLRIGYGIASAEIVRFLNKARQPFNVNSLALVAARAALADTDHLKKTQSLVASGKRFLEQTFKKLGISYVKSAANFILFTLPIEGQKAAQAFLKKGVIVREMTVYGFQNSLRVTLGTQKENQRFAKVLESIICSNTK